MRAALGEYVKEAGGTLVETIDDSLTVAVCGDATFGAA